MKAPQHQVNRLGKQHQPNSIRARGRQLDVCKDELTASQCEMFSAPAGGPSESQGRGIAQTRAAAYERWRTCANAGWSRH